MRVLLDTHIVLWWLDDDARLTAARRELIADPQNELFVSAITVAEVSIKASLGKLQVPADFGAIVNEQRFMSLPFTGLHAEALRDLPWHHRDPFDRMLVAQAAVEGIPVITADRTFHAYPVQCL